MAANASVYGVTLLDGLEASEKDKGVVPDWVLVLYLGVAVGGGVLGNVLLAASIWHHRSDLLLFLLYLAVVDIGTLLLVAPFEVWVLGGGEEAWHFSEAYCPVFLGLEVLLGSATVYLLVALNIHAVVGRARDDDDDAPGARVPALLVAVVAVSLSVPQFAGSGTVLARPQYRLCTLLDRGLLAPALSAAFRVAVPVAAMLACSLAAALRLCDAERRPGAALQLLRVALLLSLSYAALSLHRAVFSVIHALLPAAPPQGPDAFKAPPLANVATSRTATLVFAMIHYALSMLRPLLCCVASAQVRAALLGCCRRRPRPG